jgi:Tol biopolymer transport system component
MARTLKIPVLAVLILQLYGSAANCQQHTLTQLTFSDSTHDGYPYWSPDGVYIIYSSGTANSSVTMKIPSRGGSPEPVTEVFAQHARWSPAGDYIAFDGDFGNMIQMIPSSGGAPIRIDPDTIPIYMSGMPCWSPDGKKIVFKSMFTLYVMDLETGSVSPLFRPEGKNAIPYDWSPDGSMILVDVRDTSDMSQADIWEVPLNGLPRQLTFLPGRQVKPSISPDGSMIVFASDHGGNADLWIMPARGGEPVQLTFYEGEGDNPGYDIEASWSPDGKSIAFSSTRNNIWAIWKMDLDLEYISENLVEPVNYSVLFPTIDTGTIPVLPFLLNEIPVQPSPALSWDGRELVLVRMDGGRFAWIDATAENGNTLNYRERLQGKGKQLTTDKADFPAFASLGIHSEEEIRNARSITGRSVSLITVDGRPGASSGAGFMAADETVLSVIMGDNMMVRKLGLKHPDLARPLLHLWNIQNAGERYNERASPDEKIEIQGLLYGGNEIGIKISGGRGWQESIFNDEILGSYHLEAWRDLKPVEEKFLLEHYSGLKADEFELLVKMISTLHTGEMVPYYINRYGFYEGHSEFRAEPLAIAFIFGIRSLEEVHKASGNNLYHYLTSHFTENP